jgi:hypothetical protein
VVVAKRRPPVKAGFFLIGSGGFRFASTTGYYLPALQADAPLTTTMKNDKWKIFFRAS